MKHNHEVLKETIGVLSIATNIYLNYWKSMVLSADKVSIPDDKVTFFVFTENPESAVKFGVTLKNVKVRAFKIPAYSWPDATLLRYQIIESKIEEIDSDILMHLDADMVIIASPWKRIKDDVFTNQICLVEHPGFWRPSRLSRFFFYLKHPLTLSRDLRIIITHGALGAWERNPISRAYVDRKSRAKYVCGGTWFGRHDFIKVLLNELASNVRQDLERRVTAVWHDESYLNEWAARHPHFIENPELCFDETYIHLRKMNPLIVAVRKVEKTR